MRRKCKKNSKSVFKSQAAMEYLMTYGWAILIIGLALAVMYSLGVFNPKNFIPKVPPGSCSVFRPYGPGNSDMARLQGTCGYLPMYVASFDGVNDYVQVPDSSTLYSMDYITVTAWIRPSNPTYGTYQVIASKNNAYPWDFLLNPSGYLYGEIRTLSGTFNVIRGNTQLQRNSWYFVSFTFNGTYMDLFLNGKLDAQQAHTSPGVLYKYSQQVNIGGNWGNYWFNGSIANVQIYNTALTQQEIQYLYQQGLGGSPVRLQNLVAWWPLNGDAKDYSGNNNHGSINGGVVFIQNYNPP